MATGQIMPAQLYHELGEVKKMYALVARTVFNKCQGCCDTTCPHCQYLSYLDTEVTRVSNSLVALGFNPNP